MKTVVIAGTVLIPVAMLTTWFFFSRRKKHTSENKDALKVLYFDAGLQYYISARYSAISGFVPISGNLFHHAFELFIKGYLTQHLSEVERLRFRHSLKRLWKRYKREVADPALNKFDTIIASLDKFEKVRYPEPVARRGMTATIDFNSPPAAEVSGPSASQLPAYNIHVYDLDSLMKVIFAKSKMNLSSYTVGLSPDASKYLNL